MPLCPMSRALTQNCLTAIQQLKNFNDERMELIMADESKNTPNQAKTNYADVSIKELIAKPEVQEAIRRYVSMPEIVTVKKLKNPFENKETKITTQKVEAMIGTTVEDAVSFELTLVDTELDPVEAVNKKYRIIDYSFALEANMKAGKFCGYAAKGLKLMVARLEEVKGGGK